MDGRRNREYAATVMTAFTRPATWDDVKTLARYLGEAGVDYALVGGYAIAAGLVKTKQGVRPKDQMDAAVIAAALTNADRR